jgi:hypothetical protein
MSSVLEILSIEELKKRKTDLLKQLNRVELELNKREISGDNEIINEKTSDINDNFKIIKKIKKIDIIDKVDKVDKVDKADKTDKTTKTYKIIKNIDNLYNKNNDETSELKIKLNIKKIKLLK